MLHLRPQQQVLTTQQACCRVNTIGGTLPHHERDQMTIPLTDYERHERRTKSVIAFVADRYGQETAEDIRIALDLVDAVLCSDHVDRFLAYAKDHDLSANDAVVALAVKGLDA